MVSLCRNHGFRPQILPNELASWDETRLFAGTEAIPAEADHSVLLYGEPLQEPHGNVGAGAVR